MFNWYQKRSRLKKYSKEACLKLSRDIKCCFLIRDISKFPKRSKLKDLEKSNATLCEKLKAEEKTKISLTDEKERLSRDCWKYKEENKKSRDELEILKSKIVTYDEKKKELSLGLQKYYKHIICLLVLSI